MSSRGTGSGPRARRGTQESQQWTSPGLGTALGRALIRRCPRCGSTGLFTRWVSMVEACPRCGLDMMRGDGYWLGSVGLNLVVTEGIFVILLVAGLVATWPDVPWTTLTVLLVAINVLVPVAFYPISRTVWLAGERHVQRWNEK